MQQDVRQMDGNEGRSRGLTVYLPMMASEGDSICNEMRLFFFFSSSPSVGIFFADQPLPLGGLSTSSRICVRFEIIERAPTKATPSSTRSPQGKCIPMARRT